VASHTGCCAVARLSHCPFACVPLLALDIFLRFLVWLAARLGVYVVGGVATPRTPHGSAVYLSSVDRLDLVRWRWYPAPPLHVPRAALGVAAADGCLYAVGGRNAFGPLAVCGKADALPTLCHEPAWINVYI